MLVCDWGVSIKPVQQRNLITTFVTNHTVLPPSGLRNKSSLLVTVLTFLLMPLMVKFTANDLTPVKLALGVEVKNAVAVVFWK